MSFYTKLMKKGVTYRPNTKLCQGQHVGCKECFEKRREYKQGEYSDQQEQQQKQYRMERSSYAYRIDDDKYNNTTSQTISLTDGGHSCKHDAFPRIYYAEDMQKCCNGENNPEYQGQTPHGDLTYNTKRASRYQQHQNGQMYAGYQNKRNNEECCMSKSRMEIESLYRYIIDRNNTDRQEYANEIQPQNYMTKYQICVDNQGSPVSPSRNERSQSLGIIQRSHNEAQNAQIQQSAQFNYSPVSPHSCSISGPSRNERSRSLGIIQRSHEAQNDQIQQAAQFNFSPNTFNENMYLQNEDKQYTRNSRISRPRAHRRSRNSRARSLNFQQEQSQQFMSMNDLEETPRRITFNSRASNLNRSPNVTQNVQDNYRTSMIPVANVADVQQLGRQSRGQSLCGHVQMAQRQSGAPSILIPMTQMSPTESQQARLTKNSYTSGGSLRQLFQ